MVVVSSHAITLLALISASAGTVTRWTMIAATALVSHFQMDQPYSYVSLEGGSLANLPLQVFGKANRYHALV